MKNFAMLALAFVLALAPAALPQNQGGGGGGGGNNQGGDAGGGGNRGSRSQGGGQGDTNRNDPFSQQQQQSPFEQQQRPLYLSGQVMIAGGGPVPEPVTIERICDGRSIPEAYTDSKGRFSFEVGGNLSLAISDASVGGGAFSPTGRIQPGNFGGAFRTGRSGGGGLGMVDLAGCELRAVLPGYRSDMIQLGRRSVFDRPDVGIIFLHPLAGFRGAVVSATNLAAPKKARKEYEKALKEMRKKRPNAEKAAKSLEKAVEEYPRYAAAWTMLGQARMKLNNNTGAAEAFEKAIEADPKYLKPYPSLIELTSGRQDWQRTSELCRAALELNPAQTQFRYLQAVADFSRGDYEAVEEIANFIQSGQDAKHYPQTHQMMGHILSQRGAFDAAAREFRQYLTLNPNASSGPAIKKRLMEWEVLGVIDPAAQ